MSLILASASCRLLYLSSWGPNLKPVCYRSISRLAVWLGYALDGCLLVVDRLPLLRSSKALGNGPGFLALHITRSGDFLLNAGAYMNLGSRIRAPVQLSNSLVNSSKFKHNHRVQSVSQRTISNLITFWARNKLTSSDETFYRILEFQAAHITTLILLQNFQCLWLNEKRLFEILNHLLVKYLAGKCFPHNALKVKRGSRRVGHTKWQHAFAESINFHNEANSQKVAFFFCRSITPHYQLAATSDEPLRNAILTTE